jgi:cell division protein FtsI/penicillin-binding protein 2
MKFSFEHTIHFLYRHFHSLDRIGIVWYIGLAYVLFLLVTTFRFTVLDYDFYAQKAETQQTMVLSNPVSRGSIYSSDESLHGAFGVSTNLGNLAIDPSQT